jgi:hypothetical protein
MNRLTLDPHELQRRVEALEARSRRHKRWLALGLILVAAGVLMGQTRPSEKVVEANRFVLRDAEGRERARWLVGPDHSAGLGLYDQQQSLRLLVATALDGNSRFVMFNQAGKAQVQLRLSPDGRARLDLADAEGRRRLKLGLARDGTPGLEFRDADGKPLPHKP